MTARRATARAAQTATIALVLCLVIAACSGGSTTAASRVVARLVIGAEDTTQYAAIWGKRADEAAVAAQLHLLSDARDAGLTLVRPAMGTTAADSVLATLSASDTGVATIVGHNTGGVLRFADGSVLPIDRLPQNGARIAVISCSSQRVANQVGAVGVPVDIQLRLALRIEAIFTEKVALLTADESADMTVLQNTMDHAFEQAKNELPNTFAIALPIAGGGTVFGIFLLAIEREQ